MRECREFGLFPWKLHKMGFWKTYLKILDSSGVHLSHDVDCLTRNLNEGKQLHRSYSHRFVPSISFSHHNRIVSRWSIWVYFANVPLGRDVPPFAKVIYKRNVAPRSFTFTDFTGVVLLPLSYGGSILPHLWY